METKGFFMESFFIDFGFNDYMIIPGNFFI